MRSLHSCEKNTTDEETIQNAQQSQQSKFKPKCDQYDFRPIPNTNFMNIGKSNNQEVQEFPMLLSSQDLVADIAYTRHGPGWSSLVQKQHMQMTHVVQDPCNSKAAGWLQFLHNDFL